VPTLSNQNKMVKNIIVFILLIFMSYGMTAQQSIYLKTGKNFTGFKFLNSAGVSSSGFEKGIGDSFELGIKSILFYENSFSSWDIGLTLNEYNAYAATKSNNIKWETNFLGIQNSFSYSFINNDTYNISAKVGANVEKIVYGKEEINGIFYDITKTDDFKSFLLQYSFGLDAKYLVTDGIKIDLGYSVINSLNNTKHTDDKFYIKTRQISVGIYFEIDN
jgi:hypothetical protein